MKYISNYYNYLIWLNKIEEKLIFYAGKNKFKKYKDIRYFVKFFSLLEKERNQNRKIEEIKDALLSRENQNTLINITEI